MSGLSALNQVRVASNAVRIAEENCAHWDYSTGLFVEEYAQCCVELNKANQALAKAKRERHREMVS